MSNRPSSLIKDLIKTKIQEREKDSIDPLKKKTRDYPKAKKPSVLIMKV